MRTRLGWLIWCIAWVGALLCSTDAEASDRLEAARSAAGSSSSNASSSSSDWSSDDDDDVGLLGFLLSVNDDDDDDDVSVDHSRGFLPYPYADRRPGYHVRAAEDEERANTDRFAAFRMGLDAGYLYEDVWRSGLNLRLLFPRFYVEGRHDFFIEGPQPEVDGDVEVSGTVRDRLHLTTFGLGPQIAPGEHVALRVGVTGSVLFDDVRSAKIQPTVALGWGGAAEVDVYPIRPLVFSGRVALTKLPAALMYEARATVGVSLQRFEIFAGYDHRAIGKVPLGGPVVGARVRF